MSNLQKTMDYWIFQEWTHFNSMPFFSSVLLLEASFFLKLLSGHNCNLKVSLHYFKYIWSRWVWHLPSTNVFSTWSDRGHHYTCVSHRMFFTEPWDSYNIDKETLYLQHRETWKLPCIYFSLQEWQLGGRDLLIIAIFCLLINLCI